MHAAALAAAAEAAAAVRYSRDHEDVNALAAALPFSHTRAAESLTTHRAALAEALGDANRWDEAAIVGDPKKHIRLYHDAEDGWDVLEAPHRDPQIASLVHVDPHVRQYLETSLWSSTNDDGGPLDRDHNVYEFSDEAVERAHHDFQKFKSKLSPAAREAVEDNQRQAAHDLWLTRNGHGAGFWDGDWKHGDELSDAAKSLGEQYVEVEPGEDGESNLHFNGGRD